jgi:hypothetical protein
LPLGGTAIIVAFKLTFAAFDEGPGGGGLL